MIYFSDFSTEASGTLPARYWRVNVSANGGASQTAILELEMYQTKFGPNVCTGGTASASSVFDAGTPYSASKAFDNSLQDTGTAATSIDSWAGNSAVEWLAYDFGAGNEKTIVAIGMHGRQDAFKTQNPTAFTVQYSNDGSTWFTKWTVSGLSWTQREYKRLVDPSYSVPSYSGAPWGTHTFWRVVIPRNQNGSTGSGAALAEVQMRATPSGADQCTGGTASASSIFSGSFPASNAFDDNASTLWSATNTQYSWLQYQFASPVAWAELVLQARTSALDTSPYAFVLQHADSSSGPWTTAYAATGLATWTAGESRTYTDPFYV